MVEGDCLPIPAPASCFLPPQPRSGVDSHYLPSTLSLSSFLFLSRFLSPSLSPSPPHSHPYTCSHSRLYPFSCPHSHPYPCPHSHLSSFSCSHHDSCSHSHPFPVPISIILPILVLLPVPVPIPPSPACPSPGPAAWRCRGPWQLLDASAQPLPASCSGHLSPTCLSSHASSSGPGVPVSPAPARGCQRAPGWVSPGCAMMPGGSGAVLVAEQRRFGAPLSQPGDQPTATHRREPART